MRQIEHNFKKKYGQNFLIDENIINNIASSVELEKDDLVIEIGPGSGMLTKALTKKCRVLAYEIDRELEPLLVNNVQGDNLTIIWDDFLNRDIPQDIKSINYNNLYIIANLPYYITTPIIMKIIDSKLDVNKIVVMVQKEVGNRFATEPGSRDYGSITVFLNYFFNVKKLFVVSKKCFYPQPNVDSMVISLNKKTNKTLVNNEEVFFKLIRDSFQFKRKTLKNNLKEYDLDKIEAVLRRYNLDLNVRAETLSLQVFKEIANNL